MKYESRQVLGRIRIVSPTGADYIRQVKQQIDEVDPSDVRPLITAPNGTRPEGDGHLVGVAIVDVRESDEWDAGHVPGAKHVPRGYLESRIEGAVPDRSQRVVLYCASGNRSALAAKTLRDELGYENVESMTGGITLWKDRGYHVETPRRLTAEQRERYSRHFLLPEIGQEGQQKLLDDKVLLLGAGGLGAPAGPAVGPAGGGKGRPARRRPVTSPPPAWARAASSTTTSSPSPTSSARSSTPPRASARRRSTPPR